MEDTNLLSEIDNLNPTELEYLKAAIENEDILKNLWAADYEEIPVSIEEFISNPRYLGSSLTNDEGESLIYDYWHHKLHDIWDPANNYWEIAFSGAIGTGKTTNAVICMAYMLHQLLCLKDPTAYYNLTKGSHIALAFFNIGMDQVYGVGYSKLQSYLQNSEWFVEHGTIYGREGYKTYYPGKDIQIVCGSKMEHFIGRDIFAAFMDETDYARGSSLDDQATIMKMYATVKRRMESRYMKMGVIPGVLIMVSSKNSEDNFLESYINRNKNNRNLYVVDDPLWVVKASQGNYSGKKFLLAVGNKYRQSHILSDTESREAYESNGQRVIEIPIEHKEAFEQSMNQALTDIAGIAISSHSKYLSYDKIKLMYRDYLKNPFTQEIIELGFDDDSSLNDFLDERRLSKIDRTKPHYIHWDASVVRGENRTGFAMTTILSSKNVKRIIRGTGELGEVNDIVHKIVFGIEIQARPGEEIPFYKIRNFIYYLRDKLGYNIQFVSQDSFQSVDSLQNLKLGGFNSGIQSVDRTRTPYDTLKNAINEARIVGPKINVLERELIDLEDDRKRNKIDHPANGSKDVADCIAACIYNASKMSKSEMEARQQAKVLAELVKDMDSEDPQSEMDINNWL